MRDVTKIVPSPKGGIALQRLGKMKKWTASTALLIADKAAHPTPCRNDVPVGDLGSGSDYSVFIQHLGIPSTDMTSSGSMACITQPLTTSTGSRNLPIHVCLRAGDGPRLWH